jgi:undecaprenyl-diphosphatase
LEHELYGFRFFHYDPQHDSFPSGHAMTIMCVAVVLSGALPMLAPLWFAVALYLALTRAMLNSHFLSDVFIGIAIGLLASRETLLLLFKDLAPPWF